MQDQLVPQHWVRMLVASALVGLVTGVVILAVKIAVQESEKELLKADPWVIAGVLMVGAIATVVIVRFFAGRSPSTTDRYIEQFHDDPDGIEVGRAPGRLVASVTTGASGIPMGLEGPAVYAGSAVATGVKRWVKPLTAVDRHTLLVAGAAAGVAAVFKAPLAGVIFALEAPYRRTFVHSAVMPALVGSTVGYLTLIAVKGTEPEFPLESIDITTGYVFGAAVLGVACGVLARGFAFLIHRAEHYATRGPVLVRCVVAGGLLVGVFVVGRALTGENVAITAGFNASEWALDPSHSVGLLLAVLAVRMVGTGVAVGGGMVGGLFVPLLAMGAIVGALFADVASVEETGLYVIVGGAAFLGAGYGTPLAAVAFVAEITGLPGFIIPGLVAVAAGQLVMSNRTVSPAQTEAEHDGAGASLD
ncbi:MAG: chloride channel protein [Acidimicrobiia bacterium]|nr:chloride channel protein [Acidimicrobiia bacterium]